MPSGGWGTALAVESRVQYTPGPVFYANGGGEAFIRLAFSYESPEKNYEGARLIGKAILGARALSSTGRPG